MGFLHRIIGSIRYLIGGVPYTTLINGGEYIGDMKEGLPHGRGTVTYPAGTSFTGYYAGEWKDGLFHGKGRRAYPNGCEYDGEWKGSLQHGRGKLLYSDGRLEEGLFKNGKYAGE